MNGRRRIAVLAGLILALLATPAAASLPICGDFAGTVLAGETRQITCDVNLTGDLIVEGTLTGVNTFDLDGNGYQIVVQNGGRLDLAGEAKSGWVRWGDITTGWNIGDRLAVAPTANGVYIPTVITWGGSWAATPRPANSADVALVDGTTALPEVGNLTRSIELHDLRRIHVHNGAGVQTLRHLTVLNSGIAGVLGEYPLHFHLNGDTTRGSIVEGVVVENGKNHAFVPHGSHGITFTDDIAYNTTADAYWWDPPLSNGQPSPNDSNDILYDHALALGVNGPPIPSSSRLTGFLLGRGVGNRIVDSAAAGILVGNQSSGFHWPETGVGRWIFTDNVAHNNKTNGIFTWQNSNLLHVIEDFDAYRNGAAGISHGAYANFYLYRNITLTGHPTAIAGHALTRTDSDFPDRRLIFENVLTDGKLTIPSHNAVGVRPTIYRNVTVTGVTYNEVNANRSSYIIFEDTGLEPPDFTLTLIQPQSVIEIVEDGTLIHRWATGVWG